MRYGRDVRGYFGGLIAEGVIDVLVGDDVEYLCALIDEYTA